MKIENLYNNVLNKSRNSNLFFTYGIKDTLQNKIILFLVHLSFIFNKIKKKNIKNNQKIFDYVFAKIETDLREIGFGDMSINTQMKLIVNKFYTILLDFQSFINNKYDDQFKIINHLFTMSNKSKKNYKNIVKYFSEYAKKIDLISIDDIYDGNL